jgi:hypothetical protein
LLNPSSPLILSLPHYFNELNFSIGLSWIFNGRTGALVGDGQLNAKVGDKVRLFIGNAGVAKISSFHIIGEIFDRVYSEASLSNPLKDVQTTLVPAAHQSFSGHQMPESLFYPFCHGYTAPPASHNTHDQLCLTHLRHLYCHFPIISMS